MTASLDDISTNGKAIVRALATLNTTLSTIFPRATGTITLTAAATATTVSQASVASTSFIAITPTNAAARSLGQVAVTTKTAGASFVLTTAAAAGGETYDYAVFNKT